MKISWLAQCCRTVNLLAIGGVILLSLRDVEMRAYAEAPTSRLTDTGIRIDGVGTDNPIIHDNDWWFDVFDKNYIRAQASLGKANLRGNIVSRDMWDCYRGYMDSMDDCEADAIKALKIARDSGLKNIPEVTRGADRALEIPVSRRIADTVANALLTNPEIAPNIIVFGLTVTGGYNGNDAWAVYVVAKTTRYVDWGGGDFWDKGSVFRPEDFDKLPDNP